jgi:hypothetical protein
LGFALHPLFHDSIMAGDGHTIKEG